ncbi:C6 finger domain-containing protein [Colletotrichum musicola]|uniref:C6 finger domain-containing protein n=1 Tax=Colletotrichum musicola TaxID=2175873 RepID=A0A8H6IYK0_9PEZI|nr:C6 finger domain-containing protein [Colletotrichum musicola]
MVRSRGGCSNCKRRKRKCDETRPDCQACQRRGIQCEGYNTPLKWTNGIASRGRFAGAAIPDLNLCGGSNSSAVEDTAAASSTSSTRARTATESPSQVVIRPKSASVSSPGGIEGASQHSSSPGSSAPVSGPARAPVQVPTPVPGEGPAPTPKPAGAAAPPAAAPVSPGASNDPNRQLFEKFLSAGLHRLYTTESHSWIQSHFRTMAKRSRAFFVVSAAIQAYLDDGFSVAAMEHVDHALQTFRAELEGRHDLRDISTMAAGILLCTLCLLQARPFTMYLQLISGLYQLETRLSVLLPPTGHDFATRHSIEVLAVMDMHTSVIGRVAPSMGVWRRLRRLQDTWAEGRLPGIEVVSGLPRSFLDILADIADGSRQEIEARLWAWPGEIGIHSQCVLWDCWRYTAVLEARRLERRKKTAAAGALGGKEVEVAGDASPELSPPTEVVMCRLTASIYALHRAVRLPANQHLLLHNGLLYPLVVAGLEVPLLMAHPEWKEILDDLRRSFLCKDSFHAMKMIDEMLTEAWEDGTDVFDIDKAARNRGIEVAVF